VIRLDDTGTTVLEGRALLAWQNLRPGMGSLRDWPLNAKVQIDVRLDTRAWQGQNAQIFLTLDDFEVTGLTVSWPAKGLFMEGQLQPGQRALVFAGVVPGPVLRTRMALQLNTPPRWPASARSLVFHFELEPR